MPFKRSLPAAAAILVLAASVPKAALAQTAAESPDAANANDRLGEVRTQGRYQIVEATPQRVWRLDTQTGEMAVCRLNGDRLVCTSSSEAARPQPKDYEALQADQQQREQAEREQQLRFMDRMLAMFRELIRYALKQPDGGGEPSQQ